MRCFEIKIWLDNFCFFIEAWLSFREDGVYGIYIPLQKLSTIVKEIIVLDALNSNIDEEMSTYSKVFLMGEEVGEYQGVCKISKFIL